MQHTATEHDKGVGSEARLDAQCEVLFQFLFEAFLYVTGSDELAVLSKERRVVDGEEHAHRRLVDGDWRERFRIFKVCNGITNFKPFDSDNCTDITALHLIDICLSEALKDHKLLDFLLLHDVVSLAQADLLAGLEATSGYPSDCNSSDIR